MIVREGEFKFEEDVYWYDILHCILVCISRYRSDLVVIIRK